MSCTPFDCSLLNNASITPPALQPDPDVAGIGVLIGFVGTAYITFLLLVIRYIGAPTSDASLTNVYSNPIDRMILDWIWEKRGQPSSKWGPALRNCILALSDQQLVTGIAILIAGYSQLGCSLSTYHWQMIVYLAWFSSVTHLSTLSFLRRYIVDKKPILGLRLALMLVLVVMLFSALLPTGSGRWYTGDGMQAICFFGTNDYARSDNTVSMVFSEILLSAGYLTRVVLVFPRSSSFTRLWLRVKPADQWKSRIDSFSTDVYGSGSSVGLTQRFLLLYTTISVSLLITARMIVDLAESVFWELFWLLLSLVWGTLQLYSTRSSAFFDATTRATDQVGQENAWGFGQLVPVLLLIVPFLSTGEVFYETSKELKYEQNLSEASLSTSSTLDPHHETTTDHEHSEMPWLSLPISQTPSTHTTQNTLNNQSDLGHQTNPFTKIHTQSIYTASWLPDNSAFIVCLVLTFAIQCLSRDSVLHSLEGFLQNQFFYLSFIYVIFLPYLWVIGCLIPQTSTSTVDLSVDCRVMRYVTGFGTGGRVWRVVWLVGLIAADWFSWGFDAVGAGIWCFWVFCVPWFAVMGWVFWNAGVVLQR